MRAARRNRGFTLVELMVSLVAGLIVTISVVALARAATTSFYEQARLTTVEGTVRTGAERLRQDLARASFMGTGNIKLARNDSAAVPLGHKVAHEAGSTAPTSRYTVLSNLQGIRIVRGGSKAATVDPTLPCVDCGAEGPGTLSTVNGLDPDMLELTGNFTTDDAYVGKVVGNTITMLAPAAAMNFAGDPAVARLLASAATPDRAARNAFTPGSPSGALPPGGFIARVVDPRGCQHFVVVSAVAGFAVCPSAPAPCVVLTLAPPDLGGPPVLEPGATGSDTCGAGPQDEVLVSPVQRVRWFIGAAKTSTQPDPGLAAVEAATSKFDLYREVLDAAGGRVPAPGGPQVVAEYAVDLKFGITVDVPGAITPNNHVAFDMDLDGANVALYTRAASLSTPAPPAVPPVGAIGPQRVRAVRFRLVTRAALPDRTAALAPLVPAQPQYITRYCTAGPLATCTRFARVRTIMSEVTLLNQAGMRY